jgi:hypothetical protein
MLTVLLLVVAIGGTWLAGKHWWGWLVCATSEFLWMADAIESHDRTLFIMSWVWLGVNLRNAWVNRKPVEQVEAMPIAKLEELAFGNIPVIVDENVPWDRAYLINRQAFMNPQLYDRLLKITPPNKIIGPTT